MPRSVRSKSVSFDPVGTSYTPVITTTKNNVYVKNEDMLVTSLKKTNKILCFFLLTIIIIICCVPLSMRLLTFIRMSQLNKQQLILNMRYIFLLGHAFHTL